MNLIVLSIPIFFVLILAEVLWDVFRTKKYYRLNDALANISCGIFEQVTGLFAKVFLIGLYLILYQNFALFQLPTTWLWLVLMFLLIDFCYYWAHRHSHTVRLFWVGHIVHHQSEEYNLSVALRQGALQKVFVGWYYLPLAVLGFDPEWFLILNALQTLYQFWIHTELVDKMGAFGWVFNTPSHHRVHHGRNPKYIDKNHGGTLIIWDRMFGTFQAEEDRPVYGITTPLSTFDPVEAHLQPVRELAGDVARVKGLGNKLKLLFKPPGWYPKEMGGFKGAPEVDKATHQKFNVKLPLGFNIYILSQYLVILGVTALFLFSIAKLDITGVGIGTAWIILSIMTVGSILTVRSWALWLEMTRLLVLPVAVYVLFHGYGFEQIVLFGALGYVVLSFAGLLWARRSGRYHNVLQPS